MVYGVCNAVILSAAKDDSGERSGCLAVAPIAGPGGGHADDLVGQAVGDRLLVSHPEVAVEVAGDILDRLAGVVGVDLPHPLLDAQDLARLDLDVGGTALEASRAL